MELKTYYDFANNDYEFVMACNEKGIVANSLGALCQNICERFIKHLINAYIDTQTHSLSELTNILQTHNLMRLISYWNDNSNYPINDNVKDILQDINGYYFSTKYPGDDAQTLTSNEITTCVKAIEVCKKEIDRIIKAYSSRNISTSKY